MLANTLAQCGLNSSEQRVFGYLIERGPSTAGRIAQVAKLKRPTVYAALNELLAQGLVLRSYQKKTAIFSAVPRDQIPALLTARAKSRFEQVHDAAKLLESELARLPKERNLHLAGFDIAVLQSAEAVYLHLEEVLGQGGFSAIFNPQMIPERSLRGAILRFLDKTAVTKPQIREIVVSGPAARWYIGQVRNPNHEIREVGDQPTLLTDLVITADAVIFTNYQHGGELALHISEPQFAGSLQAIFDLVWSAGRGLHSTV